MAYFLSTFLASSLWKHSLCLASGKDVVCCAVQWSSDPTDHPVTSCFYPLLLFQVALLWFGTVVLRFSSKELSAHLAQLWTWMYCMYTAIQSLGSARFLFFNFSDCICFCNFLFIDITFYSYYFYSFILWYYLCIFILLCDFFYLFSLYFCIHYTLYV